MTIQRALFTVAVVLSAAVFVGAGSAFAQSAAVLTKSATNVFSESAILNGTVNGTGKNMTAWFEWGLTTSFGNFTPKNYYNNETSNYSHLIIGLNQKTTYWFRSVAQDSSSGNIYYGESKSFTTGFFAPGSGYPSGSTGGAGFGNWGSTCYGGYSSNGTCISYSAQPTVTTYSATSIANNFSTLNGYVNTNGMVVMRWFEWGTSGSNLSNKTPKTTEGTASGALSQTINDLEPNITYYFRAAAEGPSGVAAYGNILAFTTSSRTIVAEVAPVAQAPVRAAPPAKPSVQVSQAKSMFAFLTISESDTCIIGSENRAYVVSYKNIGNRTLKNVVLRVVLPQDLSFVDTTNGTYSDKDRVVVLLLGNLEAGAGGSITVRTEPARGADSGKDVVVTAYLMDTNSATGAQEELVAYSVNKICKDESAFSAAALFGGNGFLPDTLLEWLLLILTVFGLVAISLYFYSQKKVKEEASRV